MNSGFLVFAVILCVCSGIAAVIVNRFRKKIASCLSLIAGSSPLLFFMAYEGTIENKFLGIVMGMYGAAPLFLAAFFSFGFGEITKADKTSAAITMIGCLLGIIYSLGLINILAGAE
tara:strand:- start:11650 stop:12000 length:351 start_codon:yes stop_codon:yes gene_type:complete